MNKKQKAEQEKEVNWKEKYLRALADYQNLEKRMYDTVQRSLDAAREPLLLSLLEIVDDIEKAQTFIQDEGLKLVATKVRRLLAEQGVTEIDIAGKVFDPNLAEALNTVEGARDNMIVDVLRKGYMHGERILRPAGVTVSKKQSS